MTGRDVVVVPPEPRPACARGTPDRSDYLPLGAVVDDRDRIDLDQVAWGHRRYPDHCVC